MGTTDGPSRINADFVTRGASRMTGRDVDSVAARAGEIQEKFERPGPLGRFVEDARLLISLVKDYRAGRYRALPWWALAAIAFALLYVFDPIDLLPDALPVIGVLDDAAVVGICLTLVEQQIQEYKHWKSHNIA